MYFLPIRHVQRFSGGTAVLVLYFVVISNRSGDHGQKDCFYLFYLFTIFSSYVFDGKPPELKSGEVSFFRENILFFCYIDT